VIEYLQAIGWEYIPPADGIITDENAQDVIRRLRLIPSTLTENQEFLEYLRGKKTVYVDENPENNHFAFTVLV